jgi:hypothetical protein
MAHDGRWVPSVTLAGSAAHDLPESIASSHDLLQRLLLAIVVDRLVARSLNLGLLYWNTSSRCAAY